MKEIEQNKDYKKDLAIGVFAGFISGGTLLSYQILLSIYGLIPAIAGAVIVAFILWVIATITIKKHNQKL